MNLVASDNLSANRGRNSKLCRPGWLDRGDIGEDGVRRTLAWTDYSRVRLAKQDKGWSGLAPIVEPSPRPCMLVVGVLRIDQVAPAVPFLGTIHPAQVSTPEAFGILVARYWYLTNVYSKYEHLGQRLSYRC